MSLPLILIGAILEKRYGDAVLGFTFKNIIQDTFWRLKLGDRFFYDLGINQKTRFTIDQLNEIRKSTMARILCDNTDIGEIQPEAFKEAEISRSNRKVRCSSFNIPKLNLNAFKEFKWQ